MPEIFICYQRDDSAGHAGRLNSDLEDEFGAAAVFFDREDIAPGVLFPDSLQRNLEDCRILLVVIGRGWQSARLHRQGDYVFHEIDYALKHGKTVIPVLVNHGVLPDAKDLPPALEKFVYCQYLELNDALWGASVTDLTAKISRGYEIPLRVQPAAPTRWTANAVSTIMREATIALCVVFLTLTFCAIAIREFTAPALSLTKLAAAASVFLIFGRGVIALRNMRSLEQ